MDFFKYISLLENRALYFCRADILAEKFDPFEGKYPKDIVMKLLNQARTEREREHIFRVLDNPEFKKMLIINCWHINEIESYHMWKVYIERSYGVSIRSTYERLCKCFDVYKSNNVFIGMVTYDKDKVKICNSFYPYMYKRPYYISDKELRAIILNIWKDYDKRVFNESYLTQKESFIPVDLDVLIEKVVVAPGTPENVYEKIKSISKEYGFENRVERSKLDEKPISMRA